MTCFGLKINDLTSCTVRDIFRSLFLDDLAICFRGRSLDTRETFTAGSKSHTGMGNMEWFQVCGPKVQSHAFHCTSIPGSEAPHCEDWKHISASGEVNKVPWFVVGLAPLIQEAHQCAKDAGEETETLLMLYRAIVCSKLD